MGWLETAGWCKRLHVINGANNDKRFSNIPENASEGNNHTNDASVCDRLCAGDPTQGHNHTSFDVADNRAACWASTCNDKELG